MGRRTLLLVAALVVAALGTTLVFLYVTNAAQKERDKWQPVTVLVAKSEIAVGTTADQAQSNGAFESRTVSKNSVAAGTVSDIAPIQGQYALAPIYPGQQILQQMFGQTSGSELVIPKGDVAMSVQLGDPNRVAGFVQPGSNVMIFATGSRVGGQSATKTLLPKVPVIAVGPTTTTTQTTTDQTGTSNTEQLSRALLTLSVSPADAKTIIEAQSQGTLYFGLLP